MNRNIVFLSVLIIMFNMLFKLVNFQIPDIANINIFLLAILVLQIIYNYINNGLNIIIDKYRCHYDVTATDLIYYCSSLMFSYVMLTILFIIMEKLSELSCGDGVDLIISLMNINHVLFGFAQILMMIIIVIYVGQLFIKFPVWRMKKDDKE